MTIETTDDPTCAICMGSITANDDFAECHPERNKDKDLHYASIRHAYHRSCIEPWLRDVNKKCPICRSYCAISPGTKGFLDATIDLMRYIAGGVVVIGFYASTIDTRPSWG